MTPQSAYRSACCGAAALPTPGGLFYCMRCTKTLDPDRVSSVPSEETPPDLASVSAWTAPKPARRRAVPPGQLALFTMDADS